MRTPVVSTSDTIEVDIDRQLAHLVYSLTARWEQQVNESATSVDLTPRQSVVVYELSEPRRMADLAASLNCYPSNITGIVDRLESQGLVTRTPDPHDRRVTLISLSPAGVHKRKSLQAHLYDASAPFGTLTPKEKRALRELLQRALNTNSQK